MTGELRVYARLSVENSGRKNRCIMMWEERECVRAKGGLPFWNRLLTRGPGEREELQHCLIYHIGTQPFTSVRCLSGVPRRVSKGTINLDSGESK
ncbi:hypothetical protein KAX06_00770 [candidate division WOR-3 bacterium]|nr:hypothetical protein [candidate division WOR-3 bacterium]